MFFFFTSCIKEDLEECPVYTVDVYIKDKNYSNIDNVPQITKKNENSPFGAFAGMIYYRLLDAKTGNIVAETSDNAIEGSNQFYTITFPDIPQGDYMLTVWGNLASGAKEGILHTNANELTDIYVASKEISFTPATSAHQMMMERAKGNLVLICTNFPSEVKLVEQRVNTLYDTVDPSLNYKGNTSVIKVTSVNPVIETKLAPTIEGGSSKLNLRFTSASVFGTTNDLVVPEIPLSINRNQVSVVEVDYNEMAGTWEIWTYIDGKWTMIHHLDIINTNF